MKLIETLMSVTRFVNGKSETTEERETRFVPEAEKKFPVVNAESTPAAADKNAKRRQAALKKWQDPEYRAKVIASKKRVWTDEARRRSSEAKRGRKLTDDEWAEIKKAIDAKKESTRRFNSTGVHGNTGKTIKWSEEARRRLTEKKRGCKLTDEEWQKIRDRAECKNPVNSGKWSEEARRRVTEKKRGRKLTDDEWQKIRDRAEGNNPVSTIKWSEESRRAMSERKRGRKLTDEEWDAILTARNAKIASTKRFHETGVHAGKGRKLTDAQRRSKLENRRGRKLTDEEWKAHVEAAAKREASLLLFKKTGIHGSTRVGKSAEFRRKQSEAQKRLWQDPEHRAKMLNNPGRLANYAARRNTKHSEETRRKMSEAHQKRWREQREHSNYYHQKKVMEELNNTLDTKGKQPEVKPEVKPQSQPDEQPSAWRRVTNLFS